MVELYKDFIENYFHPDMQATLYKALVVFDSYALEDHYLTLNNILFKNNSDIALETVLDNFVKVIENYCKALARSLSIEFVDTITLFEMVDILEGVLNLEYYLDHDGINRVLENNSVALESFAACMNLVNNQSESDIFSLVLSISDEFIGKLKEVHDRTTSIDQSSYSPDEQSHKASVEQIINLRLLRSYFDNDQLVCFKLIRRGVPIGLDFKDYFPYIRNRVEYEEIESLSKELVGILMLSGDIKNDIIQGWRDHSAFLFDDLNKISQMDKLICKHISDFLSWKTDKVKQP